MLNKLLNLFCECIKSCCPFDVSPEEASEARNAINPNGSNNSMDRGQNGPQDPLIQDDAHDVVYEAVADDEKGNETTSITRASSCVGKQSWHSENFLREDDQSIQDDK